MFDRRLFEALIAQSSRVMHDMVLSLLAAFSSSFYYFCWC